VLGNVFLVLYCIPVRGVASQALHIERVAFLSLRSVSDSTLCELNESDISDRLDTILTFLSNSLIQSISLGRSLLN